jgi:NADH-quinone oxidoreductase subunit N
MTPPTGKDLLSILPQLIVAGAAMVVLLLDAIWPRINKRGLSLLTALGLIAAGVATVATWPKGAVKATMQGMVMADAYTALFSLILIIGGVLSVFLSTEYLHRDKVDHGEYYALMLCTILGGMVMAASVNLICVFIGLEILSISLYILAGYRTDRLESDESSLKYFLLGAFASAFFLYGIALTYGATGSLNISEISKFFSDAAQSAGADAGKNYLILAGLAMMVVGFGFKVAVVPFHIWTPDVYEGAPTSVTAFMSVSAKVAGFAAFLRVMAGGFQDQALQLQISAVLASIAALTMLVGNVVAVVQPNIKRMLAYSSIAHAGYILCGVVAAVRPSAGFGLGMGPSTAAQQGAISAVLFYSLAYTISNLGAFGVILALRRKGEEILEVSDLNGVGYRYPLLGIIMSVCMLSLAGLPPTAGFFGKLFLIQSLVAMNTPLVWLIVLFVLSSAISFYYYLGVIQSMYLTRTDDRAGDETTLAADMQLKLALAITGIGTIALGIWAGGAFQVAQKVASTFFTPGGPMSAMR